MRTRTAAQPPKPPGVVVIGGGVILVGENGALFGKAGVVKYLAELAEIEGSVVFFAVTTKQTGGLFRTQIDQNSIRVVPLVAPYAPIWKKHIFSPIVDLYHILSAAQKTG